MSVNLTKQQASVVDAVMSSKVGSTTVLRGYAGTGKTVTASEVAKSVVSLGRNVLVVAPTAAALAVLKGKFDSIGDNVSFRTISSLAQTPTLFVRAKSASGDEIASWPMDSHGLKELSQLLSSMISIDSLFSVRNKKVGEIPLESAIDGVSFDTVLFDSATANKRLKKKFNGAAPIGKLSDEMDFLALKVGDVAHRIAESNAWLVIGDEWSMVDERMSKLIESAVAMAPALGADVRLLACGDGGQLQPVDGQINSLIKAQADGQHVFELSENLRSQDEIVALATAVRGGMGIPELSAGPMFKNIARARSASAVEAWSEFRDVSEQADVTLCFTNKDVNAINMMKRAQLGYGPAVVKGERVVSLKNNGYEPGETPALVNGELLTVSEVLPRDEAMGMLDAAASSADGFSFAEKQFYNDIRSLLGVDAICMLRVATPSGDMKDVMTTPILESRMSMGAKKARASLEALYSKLKIPFADLGFAYAMTVHKAQGSEWDRVFYIISGRDLWVLNKSGDSWHMPYTAVTRARKRIDIAYIS